MIPYQDLVDSIAGLHRGPYAAPPPFAIAGQWIPSAVDSSSSKLGSARVLVAMGANYATGGGNLPQSTTAAHRKTPPWVEDKLNVRPRCRGNARDHIIGCAKGTVKNHWNGLLPCNPDLNLGSSAFHAVVPPGISTQIADAIRDLQSNSFHFVMTNLSPWITSCDWAKIRGASIEAIFALLAQPGAGGGMFDYFKQLKKTVGSDAIWIGHGNAEVYGIFIHYCGRLDIGSWFFTSNLSQPSLFAPRSPPLPSPSMPLVNAPR